MVPADNKHAARTAVADWVVAMLGERLHRYGQKLAPELVQRARELFGEEIPDQ